MKKLTATVAVSALALVIATAVHAKATASQGPWTLNPVGAEAFDVEFSVYTGEGARDGLYYYQWDVTLNPGFTAKDQRGTTRALDWIKGFYFDVPGTTRGQIDNLYGPKVLKNGVLTDLAWRFTPKEYCDGTPRTGTAGEWSAWGPWSYLYASENGTFVAGIWLDTLFTSGETFDVQLHVGSNSGATGYINWETQLTENILPPPPSSTPELSTWVLLACTGLAGIGFVRKRRK